jgi:hypothetical protein
MASIFDRATGSRVESRDLCRSYKRRESRLARTLVRLRAWRAER